MSYGFQSDVCSSQPMSYGSLPGLYPLKSWWTFNPLASRFRATGICYLLGWFILSRTKFVGISSSCRGLQNKTCLTGWLSGWSVTLSKEIEPLSPVKSPSSRLSLGKDCQVTNWLSVQLCNVFVWTFFQSFISSTISSLIGLQVGLQVGSQNGSSNSIKWLTQTCFPPDGNLNIINAFPKFAKRKIANSTKSLERVIIAIQSFAFQCFSWCGLNILKCS